MTPCPTCHQPASKRNDRDRRGRQKYACGRCRRDFTAASASAFAGYRWRPAPRPPSQTWRTFLRNHAHQIWAADLFTVPTVTFRTLYVYFVISHDCRELVHCRVTAHPTTAWIRRQLIEATAWGRKPRYVLRDRDAVYGRDVAAKAHAMGIETLLTPFRSPKANAVAERRVGPLRRECLDWQLSTGERHPGRVLREFAAHYNSARPHRSLRLQPTLGPPSHRAGSGGVRRRDRLGGLIHEYRRAAA